MKMAGGFKGKNEQQSPGGKMNVKQEMMSPNNRNMMSSNNKNMMSPNNNNRNNLSGNQNDKKINDNRGGNQKHGGGPPSNNRHGGQGGSQGGNNNSGDNSSRQSAPGEVPGMSAASVAALATRDEKKFTGRCRLFVGNLTPDITEDDFRKLFQPFGEISEVYVNAAKGFGFIRLDYRHNSEAAKAALDGMQRKGRTLRVRYASLGSALKVKNLSQHVSNELLHQAFSQFGEVERAVVIVDDRGRPTGEGIVEFARKPGAQAAYKRITEGVFLLTSAPRPVTVEPLDQKDEEDGYPEKFINKSDGYKKDRESDPRFAPPGSFEYEFGLRWKELEELEKQQHDSVKKAMEESRLKLEDEMENAMFEQQAEMIRQDLLRQQEELRRLEEMRQQEQIRRRQELEMRLNSNSRQNDDDRRRQEEDRRRSDLLMRSQEIRRRQMGGDNMRRGDGRPGDMMGRQGGSPAMNDNQQRGRNAGAGAPPLPPPPPPPAGMGLDRPGQNQMPGSGNMSGNYNYNNQGGPMGGQNMGGGPGANAGNSNNMGGGPSGGGMAANNMAKMNQNVPNRMRQGRYDQPGDNNFGGSDNYGSAGMGSNPANAMSGGGAGGPPISSGQMGGGPNGPPSLFNSNMGGNMPGAGNSGMRGGGGGGGGAGNNAERGNMMDNRRRENPNNREDYTDMKRMRRY